MALYKKSGLAFCKKKWLLLFAVCSVFMHNASSQPVDTVFITAATTEVNTGVSSYIRTGAAFTSLQQPGAGWNRMAAAAHWFAPGQTHWMALVVSNKDTVDQALKLYFNNVQAGIISIYFPDGGGAAPTLVTGSLVPLSQRASPDRLISVPFTLKGGATQTVYCKIFRKGIGITLTPVLYRIPHEPPRWPDMVLLVALTVIFMIMIAAAFVWWFQPSVQIAWFFLYIFFGFFYTLAASGFGAMYVWPHMPRFEENAAVFWGSLSTAALLFFSGAALKMRYSHKKLYYYIFLSAILYALAGTVGFLFYSGNYDAAKFGAMLAIPYLLTLSSFFFLLVISVVKGVKAGRGYWWFTAIFISFFIMAIFLTLLELGIIRFNYLLHPLLLALGALPQMLLALVFLVYKTIEILKNRAVEVEHEKLASQQVLLNERLRISQELHDEVGATLSGIAMYTHLAREQLKSADQAAITHSLTVIQGNAGEMVNKLNDIVWLINPGHDSLQELLQRLEDYAVQMTTVKQMQFRSNTAGHYPGFLLSTAVRRNIYLLFKEAINNGVKYSGGTILELMVKDSKDCLEIQLIDNGAGFNADTVRRGNGLNNMQQRALEAGLQLHIRSEKNKGTAVSVRLAIT